MSTSLLAFLTLLEKRFLPLLPADKTWRFQRLVDFRAHEGTLQLWEEPGGADPALLTGQVAMRETQQENTAASYSGTVQNVATGAETRKFSFHPQNDAEVERQAQLIAEMWHQSLQAEPQ